MLTGIILIDIGVLLQVWQGRRAFHRRNGAGLETFSSYGKALGTQAGERLVLILARLLLLLGVAWLASAWLVGRL
ncbi:hypothetical protein [Deinococcus enclensis]|uniref:Protein-export membrane protein SecG n=1 Tax=Deinococcus enclensis TaxID=1049582 RepID=A0ABT9MG52_9DEIO|nr:hypothetical protein [Deinococcus enclensis]MDP9765563.1 hypothetical protein [Deinococcus enclensis]